jgi:hypothetical protein
MFKTKDEELMFKNNNKDLSKNIKTILWVIAAVLIWLVLQSFTGVPMKM